MGGRKIQKITEKFPVQNVLTECEMNKKLTKKTRSFKPVYARRLFKKKWRHILSPTRVN